MLKFITGFLGLLLLLPIAIIIVALIMISLVGGYFSLVSPIFWAPVVVTALIIIVCKLLSKIFKRYF